MAELVCDWMSPAIISVAPEIGIDEADEIMGEHEIRRLAVIEDGELVGILSLGDLQIAAAANGRSAKPQYVRDIMSDSPVTIPSTASIALAAQTMLAMKVSGLPVINDGGGLCGMLSQADLLRFIVDQSQYEIEY